MPKRMRRTSSEVVGTGAEVAPAGTVSLGLFVKERDSKSQHITLDVKIDGHNPLVATSSNIVFEQALNEVRDEMIRQITDMKTKSEPRNNRHLRDSTN